MLTLIPREEQWQYRDINKDEAIWKRAATEAAIESGEDEFSRDLNALVFEQSYTIEDQTRLLDENSIRETKDELDRIVEMANERSKYNEEALSIQKTTNLVLDDWPSSIAIPALKKKKLKLSRELFGNLISSFTKSTLAKKVRTINGRRSIKNLKD